MTAKKPESCKTKRKQTVGCLKTRAQILREEGEERKAKETAKNLYDMGLSVEQIVQAV